MIDLKIYRTTARKAWRKKHSVRLECFISKFIGMNVTTDYLQVSSFYRSHVQVDSEVTWDYAELRDRIRGGLDSVLGDALYESLNEQWWFEAKFVDRDEVIDRCLTTYILGSIRAI